MTLEKAVSVKYEQWKPLHSRVRSEAMARKWKKSIHIFFKCFSVKGKKKSVAVGQCRLVEDFKNYHCWQWWYCALFISRYFSANGR